MNKDFASDRLRLLLNKKTNLPVRLVLYAACVAVFFVFALNARYAKMDEYASFDYNQMLLLTAGVYTCIFAVSLALQFHLGKGLPSSFLILMAVVTGAVLLAKISLLDYVSDDYDIFLSNWIYSYTGKTIKEGLGWYIESDYTPPYLYLLLLISRVGTYPWLYLVKAWSILTDILLGYAVMKLASLKVRGTSSRILIFHIAQILPTVVFNGAYWGQCDVIYTSICLLGLYMLLTHRSAAGTFLFGIALSFKLQVVFFLPALLPLWLRKDLKLRDLVLIPAGYMAMMIPALWGGKSLHHVLHVYLSQAGSYSMITINGPTLYQFFPKDIIDTSTLYNMFGGMAMLLAFGVLAALCMLICMKSDRLDAENTMLWTVLVLAAMPFLLPKMHERYLFGADVAALVLAAYSPKRIVIALLFGLSSYIAYTAGLPGDRILDLKWASLFELAGILLTAAELAKGFGFYTNGITEAKE